MKKITFLLLIISVFSFGQRIKFETFHNNYLNKDFSVFVVPNNKNYFLNIGLPPKENLTNFIYVDVYSKSFESFKNSFLEAKNKFSEWKKTSTQNNITDVSKEIEIKTEKFGFSFVFGDTIYSGFKPMKLSFKYLVEDSKPFLVFYSNGFVSANNQFIRTNGFELRFEDENEIDEFLAKISPEKVIKFLEDKNKTENLLK